MAATESTIRHNKDIIHVGVDVLGARERTIRHNKDSIHVGVEGVDVLGAREVIRTSTNVLGARDSCHDIP